MRFSVPLVIAVFAFAFNPGRLAADSDPGRATAVTFLKQHCAQCHNAEKPKGRVRVDDLTGDVRTEGSRWALILQQVHGASMPPEDASQPDAKAKAEFLRWTLGQLAGRAQPKPNQGNLVPHRLLFGPPDGDPEATKANVDYKGKPKGDVFKPVPLDTRGEITGTDDPKLDGPVQDARELVTRIADSDHCRQVWIRHVFRYYLGRNETLADAQSLQEADQAYVKSGGSFKALLVALLTSDSFLKRPPATTAKP
jgi:mono/diheme cytochrome c family protein